MSWGNECPSPGSQRELDRRPQQSLYLCIGTVALRFKVMEIEV